MKRPVPEIADTTMVDDDDDDLEVRTEPIEVLKEI